VSGLTLRTIAICVTKDGRAGRNMMGRLGKVVAICEFLELQAGLSGAKIDLACYFS
jgi:hypothetical protein